MSLILDALRKIEQDRKARRPGGIDLRPEVLSYKGRPQKALPVRGFLLVGCALLLVTGFSAAIFLRSEKKPAVTRPATAEPVRLATAEPPPLAPAPPQPLPSPPARVKADTALPAAAARPVPQSPDAATGGGDNITVSGIAWQEERVLRRAVINGLLLAEGAEVLGAQILEIKENRVRFSRSGQVFEVLYPSPAGR